MGVRDLALPRPPLRPAVMGKINLYLLKRSTAYATNKQFYMLTHFRLSREEREAAYIKARERIFGANAEKAGDDTLGMIISLVYVPTANRV